MPLQETSQARAPTVQSPQPVHSPNPTSLQYGLLQQAVQFTSPTQYHPPVQGAQLDGGNQNGRGTLPTSATQPSLVQRTSSNSSYGVASPGGTPGRARQDFATAYPLSPEGSKSGNLTEPRNYAPRTSGMPIANEPPPKFDLGVQHYSSPQQQVSQDPFSPGHGHSKSLMALQAIPETPPAYGYGAVAVPAIDLREQRSAKLNALTSLPSGLPTMAMAMDPTYFPFIENGRQAKAINNGVVKLKNVSGTCNFDFSSLI